MSVVVVGEALIDLIAGDDNSYRPHLGGSPYNVAIGLARQGIDVSYLSSLSDDSFGDQLHSQLVTEGVRLPLERRSLFPTSLAMVTLDSGGQPSYRLYREGIADKDTTFEDVVDNVPDDVTVFHTGSLALTPSQLPKVRELFDWMHEHDVLISIDINIRLRASIDTGKYLAGVRSLLKYADIVKASDEDINAFELNPNVRRSAEMVYSEMGDGVLILTEGSAGSTLYGKHGSVNRPAPHVADLVDTVGAGDTFHSAFLAFLDRAGALSAKPSKISLNTFGDALDFAGAAAAVNVSRAGCSPPTHKEVIEFMRVISV